jgi:hypothetical protein
MASDKLAKVTASRRRARSSLRHPQNPLGELDPSTLPGKGAEQRLPPGLLSGQNDESVAFEAAKRLSGVAGAYEPGTSRQWPLALEIKPPPRR